MYFKNHFCIVFILLFSLWGCGHTSNINCKPALFPYPQYKLKAESIRLDKIETQKIEGQKIEISDLQIIVPKGWHYEEAFKDTFKFTSDDGRLFILFPEKDKPISDSTENYKFIGCNNFNANTPVTTRPQKDYFTDLYFFTDDQLSDDHSYWEYFVLWSKTGTLRHAIDLYYFNGDNLEAFQKNINPAYMKGSMLSEITIFPKTIAPNHLTIASRFTDDPFFKAFLEMLDTLNP